MKLSKKIVLVIGMLLLGASTIYPPWVYTYQQAGISQVQIPAGYSLLFTPPKPLYDILIDGVKLDVTRYLYQLVIIAVVCGGLYVLVPGNKERTG